MHVIRGLHNLRPHRGCVATIGNFDGVHLGHRAVFHRLLAKGRELGLPATVITFEPQAMEYFAPQAAPARLTRLREKLAAIQACGIQRVVLLEFGPKLAGMDARAFVVELLVKGLQARHLLVGDDFRFGRGRLGDFGLLRELGAVHGFAVEDLHTITHGAERVSSTRIRETLARGELDLARHLLGRPYRICGRVGHGNNIGLRPTLGDQAPRYLLEVHLFDFAGDLYGRHAEVEFRLKLRDEMKFASFDELKARIQLDARAAREYLRVAPPGLD